MPGPGELADFKFVRAKIDQQTMFKPRRFQIAEDLRLMLRGECLGSLQFNDQRPLHEQVRQIVANQRSILVIHFDRMLLLHVEARLPQPMRQRIFINFL